MSCNTNPIYLLLGSTIMDVLKLFVQSQTSLSSSARLVNWNCYFIVFQYPLFMLCVSTTGIWWPWCACWGGEEVIKGINSVSRRNCSHYTFSHILFISYFPSLSLPFTSLFSPFFFHDLSLQNKYKMEAMRGQGVDRHLFGLYCVAKGTNMDPLPDLFTDKVCTAWSDWGRACVATYMYICIGAYERRSCFAPHTCKLPVCAVLLA